MSRSSSSNQSENGRQPPVERGRSQVVNRPILCPVLVGRSSSLQEILAFVERAQRGSGGTLLVSGEAGIGKTRLIEEASAALTGEEITPRIVRGHCFEQDRSMPFAPLADLLRSWLDSTNPKTVAEVMSPVAADVSLLLPELRELSPTLRPPATTRELEIEKQSLIHSLVHLITGLVAASPAVVIVEDIHWCDNATLDFLLQLARRAVDRPLVILLTYRSDETNAALRHVLASLDRERLASEIQLGPLSLADVDEMLRSTFEQRWPVRSEFLHAMWGLTEGNPYFIEEVLKSLVASGDIFYRDETWSRKTMSEIRIPRSVRDAVHVRIEPLGVEERRVLEIAAVAGRGFDFTLLQQATQLDEERLLAFVKELIAAQLIIEVSGERFAFRHALTRESIYDELLARERVILHRQIAGALERVVAGRTDQYIADLAYHTYEGGDWAKAAEYCHRAGDRAMTLFAPETAIEFYSQALDACIHADIVPPVEMLRHRGRCHEWVGDFDAARRDYEAVLAAGEPELEWQALLDLGVLWSGRDYHRGGYYFERAHEVARESSARAPLAYSLNHIGNWRLRTERTAEAQASHLEALAIFEDLGDRAGIVKSLNLLGMSYHVNGRLADATSAFRRAITYAEEIDERQELVFSLATMSVRGLAYHSDLVQPAATLTEAAVDGEAAVRIAREIGWRAGEAYALMRLGTCLGAQGIYGRALDVATRALDIAEEIEHRQWMAASCCALGALGIDMLDTRLAAHYLERGKALSLEIGSSYWYRVTAAHLAQTYMLDGEVERAEDLLDEAVGAVTPFDTLGQRQVWLALAELELKKCNAEHANRIARGLIAAAGGTAPVPRIAWLLARTLVALKQRHEIKAVLQPAADVAAEHGARPMLWRIQSVLHDEAATSGDRQAERMSIAATAIVTDLASTIEDTETRKVFLERVARHLPQQREVANQRDRQRTAVDLTARELEVVKLVASGGTNRSIAGDLVVSERTVETHISNILAKLDFSSRTQIATWAVRQGLGEPSTESL